MATNPTTGNPFRVPAVLKDLSDWYKILGFVSLVVGVGAGYYLGKEKGAVVGLLVAVAFFAVFVLSRVILSAGSSVVDAIQILSASDYTKMPERQPVIERLKEFRRSSGIAFVVMLAVTL